MEEVNDVKALEKISNEVDESQIKVILSSQCIKAQAFLLDKLKKQTERHKETCRFISSANLKVEAEIKQAEQEIRSLLIAKDTIKSSNVETKKEWLLAKNKKADIIERVTEGKNKYEALWSECKTRYESVPFVQKLLQAKEKQKTTDQDIDDMDKQITKLYEDIETKRKICADLDIKRCVELANFMINEMPNTHKIIAEKSEEINVLSKEIEQLLKEQENHAANVINDDLNIQQDSSTVRDEKEIGKDDDTLILSKDEDDPLIPKLNIIDFDLDVIDVNLNQVKLKKDELKNYISTRSDPVTHNFEKNVEPRLETDKAYEYIISPYFKRYKEEKTRNFSEKKLINILEDININNSEAYNIVKKVNPEHLRDVDEISAEVVRDKTLQSSSLEKDNKAKSPIISENIEEIDLTSSNAENNIIIPPTQFLDITLSDDTRKRVCFDLSSSVQINEIVEDTDQQVHEERVVHETTTSQLDVSAASDESFVKIKEMLLKKHNLDLSPQFVYAKNNVLQKKDDKIVTSKFFQNNCELKADENTGHEMEVDKPSDEKQPEETVNHDVEKVMSQKDAHQDVLIPMDIDEPIASSPMPNKVDVQPNQEQKPDKPISGLLFTHGTQAIPDSLNVSMSTTGFDDSDFPHCIDSSLLLSPKADIPSTANNQEVLSQEVPNFLSGFRKTGLSFFGGQSTSSEPKPDSSAQNEGNNFSFNFGGEKKRGGLFSLFH
ncbi:uncharacterized protein LOC142977730 [Anticarsia gemmatalis]|uniref:uncharacterized protein LOC142977730 n=1 Tax=Anticarsia gemmatalis TaxID=129554 RepID=UPI003F75C614